MTLMLLVASVQARLRGEPKRPQQRLTRMLTPRKLQRIEYSRRRRKPVWMQNEMHAERQTFGFLQWDRPHSISLHQAFENTEQDPECFEQWWELVVDQFATFPPTMRSQILTLSAEGKTPRQITKHFSVIDHGLYVAAVELVVQAASNPEDSEGLPITEIEFPPPVPDTTEEGLARIGTAVQFSSINPAASEQEEKQTKRSALKKGFQSLLSKPIKRIFLRKVKSHEGSEGVSGIGGALPAIAA
jgi:hypothetical protein